jgi:hypothetical protein
LALIPLLFAVQQFSEGILWLTLQTGNTQTTLTYLADSLFKIFAFLVWPIWIPLSLFALEKSGWRKNVLFLFLCAGILLAFFHLVHFLTHDPMTTRIVNNSIQYRQNEGPAWLYASIVLIPCFLSRVKYVWLFGLLGVISWAAAQIFYQATFTSVWCFFAALISVMIYIIVSLY